MSVQVEDERRKLQGSNEGKEEEMAKNDETGASPRKNWHPTLAFLRVEQVLGRIGAIVGKKNECRTFEGLHGEGLLGGTGGSSSNNWRRFNNSYTCFSFYNWSPKLLQLISFLF